MRFEITQNPSDNSFSYEIINEAGNALFISDSFPTREDCTSSIESSVQALADPARYVTQDDGSLALVSADGTLLARSEAPFDGQNVEALVNAAVEETRNTGQFEVSLTTTSTRRTSRENTLRTLSDEELAALYNFAKQSTSGTTGFELFQSELDDQYYFHFNDADGQALLYSRGFSTAGQRGKRLESVIQSAARENRFEVKEEHGLFYFILKARNGQEIARSRTFPRREEAIDGLSFVNQTAPSYAEQYAKKRKRRDTTGTDDYLLDVPSPENTPGFVSFKNPSTNRHYFHLNDTQGDPLLYSQGYTSGRGRDNGIRSVIRNSVNETSFVSKEENGSYFFAIVAGNRQEIARSRPFATSASRDEMIAFLLTWIRQYAPEYGVTFETTSTTETFTLAGLPVPAAEESEAQGGNIDDYLLDVPSPTKDPGFIAFQNSENALHYFHLNDRNGTPFLYSEGYTAERSRDNGIRSVIKNSVREEAFIPHDEDGVYYFTLMARNRQEIARSRSFASADERDQMMAFLPGWAAQFAADHDVILEETEGQSTGSGGKDTDGLALGTGAAVGAGLALAGSGQDSEDESSSEVDSGDDGDTRDGSGLGGDIDDYLLDVPSPTKDPGFIAFQNSENALHYFHLNDRNGTPFLYSEGYMAERSRDNGIRSVIKNSVREEAFIPHDEDGVYYFTLMARNRQEIARSRSFASADERDQMMAFLPGWAAQFAADHDVILEETEGQSTGSGGKDTDGLALGTGAAVGAGLALAGSGQDSEDESSSEVDSGDDGDTRDGSGLGGDIDDYLLDVPSPTKDPGFIAFQNSENALHYFHLNDRNGTPFLYSEGYMAERSRDNGIRSVIKNSVREEAFIPHDEDGVYYFTLMARNRQEIARSRSFASADERDQMMAFLPGWAAQFAADHDVILEETEGQSTGSGGKDTDGLALGTGAAVGAGLALAGSGRDSEDESSSEVDSGDDGDTRDGSGLGTNVDSELKDERKEEEVTENESGSTGTGTAIGTGAALGAGALLTGQGDSDAESEDGKDTEDETAELIDSNSSEETATLPGSGVGGDGASGGTPVPELAGTGDEEEEDDKEGAYATTEDSGGGWLRLPWWIIPLLLLLLLLFLLRGCFGFTDLPQSGLADSGNESPQEVAEADNTLSEEAVGAINLEGSGSSGDSEDGSEDAGNASSETLAGASEESEDSTAGTPDETTTTRTVLGPNAQALGFAPGTLAAQIADMLSNQDRSLPATFVMDKVAFPSNSAKLNKGAYDQVDNLIKLLKAYPNIVFEFVGHIDGTEKEDSAREFMNGENITLSEVRARCLVKKFEEESVSSSQVAYSGLGSTQPIANNNTAANRQQNRRLELKVRIP